MQLLVRFGQSMIQHHGARHMDDTLPLNRGTGTQKEVVIQDRKSTRLNSSHVRISYAVFCLKKKKKTTNTKEGKKTDDSVQLTVIRSTQNDTLRHARDSRLDRSRQ